MYKGRHSAVKSRIEKKKEKILAFLIKPVGNDKHSGLGGHKMLKHDPTEGMP
jgi:hypothetical protein